MTRKITRVAIWGDVYGLTKDMPVSTYLNYHGETYGNTLNIHDHSEAGQYVAGGFRRSANTNMFGPPGGNQVMETNMTKVLPVLKRLPPGTEVFGNNNIQAQWLHDLGIRNVGQLVVAIQKGMGGPGSRYRSPAQRKKDITEISLNG